MLTYDANQVSILIGTNIVSDFESVTVEQQEDGWTFSAGSSGEASRSKNSNRLTTVTLSLLQTKTINLQLSALYESDSVLPITIKDNNGNSLHFIPEGTIVKIPSSEYSKTEAGTRDWTIVGTATVNVVGGN